MGISVSGKSFCYCNTYKTKTIYQYEKVALVKQGDKIIEYSLKNNRQNGYHKETNPPILSEKMTITEYERMLYNRRNGGDSYECYLNYFPKKFLLVNKGRFFNPSTHNSTYKTEYAGYTISLSVPYFEIGDLGINQYSEGISIDEFPNCVNKNEQSQILNNSAICWSFNVEMKYNKLFPTKNYTPQPRQYSGTGFFINKNGLIATNYHVIQEYIESSAKNKSIEISYVDKIGNINKYFAECAPPPPQTIIPSGDDESVSYRYSPPSYNKHIDIAFLQIINAEYDSVIEKHLATIPYSFALRNYEYSLGQDIFTLGFPLSNILGDNIKLSLGNISSSTGILDDTLTFTTNLNVNPGNSGGPILNYKGEIIGIISSRVNDKVIGKTENVSFGIKNKAAHYWLGNYKCYGKKNNVLLNKKMEEQIKLIKPYIVKIIVTIKK